MAMSGGSDDGEPMMEMNTTPLIDVMLVLLIMLMITVPPVTHAVDIDLPVPTDAPPPAVLPDKNKIVIMETGEIQWNGTPVSPEQVAQYLQQSRAINPEPVLEFQPQPNAPYDAVDKMLAIVKKSKISGFGFVGNQNYGVFGKSAQPGG
jgi:biopolymer transport protein ExbD